MRPTYSDSEITCYRIILGNPGCTLQDIQGLVHYSPDTVEWALVRLYRAGNISREQSEEIRDRPGPIPYCYTAIQGTRPIQQHQRDAHERLRQRGVLSGGGKKLGLRKNQAKGWLMTKREWETLVINYEHMHPGYGDLMIYEHQASRILRGAKPELSMKDYPRLKRMAEKLKLVA